MVVWATVSRSHTQHTAGSWEVFLNRWMAECRDVRETETGAGSGGLCQVPNGPQKAGSASDPRGGVLAFPGSQNWLVYLGKAHCGNTTLPLGNDTIARYTSVQGSVRVHQSPSTQVRDRWVIREKPQPKPRHTLPSSENIPS